MTSKWWLGSAASAAIVSILVACAPPAEVTGASNDRVTTGTFDKNDVVSDDALLDKDALTTTQIQAFLDKTPWSTKSVLAGYTEGGQSAAEIITAASQKYGINPIALLVRVQMEQSLLYKATAPDTTIAIAFGCGCPHSSICSAKYEGFANQANCAAGTLSRSIAAATTSTGTASGWKKGVIKMTVDNVNVNPANAATAALYTYTPYVGEAGGGAAGVGGASLHKSVWDKVTTTLAYTPTARTGSTTTDTSTTTTTTTDGGPSTTDPTYDGSGDDTTTTTLDAGSPSTTTAPPSTTKSTSSADDSSLLSGGNAPPTSNNVPLPQASGSHKSSSSSATTTSGSASSDQGSSSASNDGTSGDGTTDSKAVASSGCSSTGHAGGGSGLFAGISVAIVGLLARRRRR